MIFAKQDLLFPRFGGREHRPEARSKSETEKRSRRKKSGRDLEQIEGQGKVGFQYLMGGELGGQI